MVEGDAQAVELRVWCGTRLKRRRREAAGVLQTTNSQSTGQFLYWEVKANKSSQQQAVRSWGNHNTK